MPKLYVENLDQNSEFSLQDPTGLAGMVLRVGAGATVPFDMSWSQLNAFEPRLKDAVIAGMVTYRVENTDQTVGDNQRAAVTLVSGNYQVVATDEVVVVQAVPCTITLTVDPGKGHVVKVIDATGMGSTMTPITIQPAPGTGAINGGGAVVIDSARGAVECSRSANEWLACACAGVAAIGPPPSTIQTNGAQTVPLYNIAINDQTSGHLDLAVAGASSTANAVYRISVAVYRNDSGPGLVVSPVAVMAPPVQTDPGLGISVSATGPGTVTAEVTGTVGAGVMNWDATPLYRQAAAPVAP